MQVLVPKYLKPTFVNISLVNLVNALIRSDLKTGPAIGDPCSNFSVRQDLYSCLTCIPQTVNSEGCNPYEARRSINGKCCSFGYEIKVVFSKT